jgi:adenylate cyclase
MPNWAALSQSIIDSRRNRFAFRIVFEGKTMDAQPDDPAAHSDPETERAYTLWHSYLTGDTSQLSPLVKLVRQVFIHLPSAPRCRVCNAPFHGIGGAVVGVLGFGAGRSSFNPSLCGRCEIIIKKHQVGAEIQLTLLFADVRGSSTLAEEIGVSAFHKLINRYYQACGKVLAESNALVVRLIGDAVIGLYVPGIAGREHARTALESACTLLKDTGHADREGPWIQVGIGVQTGRAYVGAVGSSNMISDITVLGDVANSTARLCSQAQPGEILVSKETYQEARLPSDDCELRLLQLKGRSEPMEAYVVRVSPHQDIGRFSG